MRTLILTILLAGCGGEPPYAGCEQDEDCAAFGGDPSAACRLVADVKVCTWTCTVPEDCEGGSDDRVCADPPAQGINSLCLPVCGTDDVCPTGYSCTTTGAGIQACFPG